MDERTTRSEIGERIRSARIAAGYTQESLAHAVNVVASTARSWEIGERMPMADRLPGLADALGVTVGWLITGEGDGPTEAAA